MVWRTPRGINDQSSGPAQPPPRPSSRRCSPCSPNSPNSPNSNPPIMSASTRLRHTSRRRPPFRSKLAVAFFCFTFGSFLWIWLTLLYHAYHYPTVVIPAILGWLSYIFLIDSNARYDGWTPTCRNLSLWTRHMRSYFSSTDLVVHEDLLVDAVAAANAADAADAVDAADAAAPSPASAPSPSNAEVGRTAPNLFLYHPHGVLAIGAWMALGCNALGLDDKLGGRPTRLVTLNINFFAPFLREFLLSHGVCSCAKKALLTLLRRNENVALVVGGSRESLLSKQGTYDLVLRRRRGFAQVALATGCNLVPVVGFGETDCYSTWNDWKGIQWVQKKIGKTLGFTVPIAMGRGLFLPWGLLPHSCSIRVVTGRPVPVARYEGEMSGPLYEGAVEEVKRRYEIALIDLFKSEGVDVRIVE